LTGITNGSDPVYDGAKSEAYFATAKQELIASGDLTADDFPIQLDVIGSMNLARQPYEQSMYSDLVINSNGVLQVGYNIPATDTQNSDWGSVSNNFDFSLWSGWGPDYADPQTFLHTMIVGGDMVDSMGFDGSAATLPLEQKILGDYTAEYNLGAAVTDPTKLDERYTKFAQAEYDLIYKYAIIIPWLSVSGYRPVVSNTVPLTAGRATYGLTSDKYKDIIVTDSAITQTQRAAIQANYDANK
jgi:oligopeptide transport system substrate-binding protein